MREKERTFLGRLRGSQRQSFPLPGPVGVGRSDSVGQGRSSSPSDKSTGGIVLPEMAKDEPKEGNVIAVGNGKVMEDGKRQAMQLKSGDQVLFTSYAGVQEKIKEKIKDRHLLYPLIAVPI